jgi:hypothetical protein
MGELACRMACELTLWSMEEKMGLRIIPNDSPDRFSMHDCRLSINFTKSFSTISAEHWHVTLGMSATTLTHSDGSLHSLAQSKTENRPTVN